MTNIESPESGRYTIFPIICAPEWEYYKKARQLFWVDEEIELELLKDPADWAELTPDIKNFIEHILAFFAVSDGVVNETLTEQILSRVQMREIRFWYDFQVMMEDIHNIVYSKLIDTYIKDSGKKHQLFNAIEFYPTIQKKVKWIHKWTGRDNEINALSDEMRGALQQLQKVWQASNNLVGAGFGLQAPVNTNVELLFEQLGEERPSLAHLILINTITEGVFFQGSFCAIGWICHHYGKLPGLSKANEFISRDEGLHTAFGINLYRTRIHDKIPQADVFRIMNEAVAIESEFISSALPINLFGMNAELMSRYIKYTADQLLVGLGYNKLYRVENPFNFMKKQSISVRMSDFFVDQNISEYGHAQAGTHVSDNQINTIDF